MVSNKAGLWAKAVLADGPVRVDGVTYYLHGGKVRMCLSKRKKRKSRTEKELEMADRFTEVRKLWKVFRMALGDLPVWRIAAREGGVAKSDALFHRLNAGCIRPGEGVWAWSGFCFSAGSLDRVELVGVERRGWTVRLEWVCVDDSPRSGAADCVYVGYFYDGAGRAPGMVSVVGACRGDGVAEVEIPAAGMPDGTPLHLYLFFGNVRGDRFSPSVYVKA